MQDTTPSQDSGLAPIYAPRAGDDALQRGNAYVNSADILTMESYPLQFAVVLKGDLPTPCNELRVAYNPPDAENKIQLEVYSVADPNAVCAQMLESFEQNVSLGSFPGGHYTVWVNGKQMGEFDA
jgi:inhibitor of cysteine peptidase